MNKESLPNPPVGSIICACARNHSVYAIKTCPFTISPKVRNQKISCVYFGSSKIHTIAFLYDLLGGINLLILADCRPFNRSVVYIILFNAKIKQVLPRYVIFNGVNYVWGETGKRSK